VELAAALRLGEPRLFVARISWARRAFAAREVPEDDLRASLEALAGVLTRELPEAVGNSPATMLAAALAELDRPLAESDTRIDPRSATGRLTLEYLATVLEGDSRGATERVLAEVDAGLAVEAAYLE